MNIKFNELMEKRKQIENMIDVSFFIPCLNEEKDIIPTLKMIIAVATQMELTFEILVYNDGSTDNTRLLVEEYIEKHPDVLIRIINRKARKGLGCNYIDGAFLGFGKYYMMICGDHSETEESLKVIFEQKGKADMIIPYFGHLDKRNILRRKLSRLFTNVVNFANGYNIKYYNGVVLHMTSNVRRWHPTSVGFAYQAELISLLLDEHKSYIEILISNRDRKEGFSRAFYFLNILSVVHSILQILFRRIRVAITPKQVT